MFCRTNEKNVFGKQITYIIVGKRHHTRFFPMNQNDAAGKAGNVKPGLLVEKGVCHYYAFDFFLCSHFGLQGTSRPAHYYILYDDSNYRPEELQLFSYYLCHVYARCLRSVSIPAPVYYAHLCAFRARYHLGDGSMQGSDTASYHGGRGGAALDDEAWLKRLNEEISVQDDVKSAMYFA